MDANFWHQKWESNEIGFHRDTPNPLLVSHFNALSLAKDSRIFLPLCGKTLDIGWLLSQNMRVVGVELSETAIRQLFISLGIVPRITENNDMQHYQAENIDIFAGDFFNLSSEMLGTVDAIYDRAALVALPAEMRSQYTAHLMAITHMAPQLLICFEYDPTLLEGPPFSINSAEIRQHYANSYELTLLQSTEVAGGLKEQCAAQENVWLLEK